jgi:hypothetical protein
MTTAEILTYLERFQTSIVGIIGFAGVILTLIASSLSSRREHQRQVETRRTALRRILAAELRNYARALRKNLEQEKPAEAFISVGRIRRLLSDHLTADLGLLEVHEIDIVVNALISLNGMEHFLSNISSKMTDDRFLLPHEKWEDLRIVCSTTADALDYAVQALEFSIKGKS